MPFKGTFTFGQQQDEQHQFNEGGASMEPYREHGRMPTVFRSNRVPQVTPERYLRRMKYEEVVTNDSTVNLNSAMAGVVVNKLINVATGFGGSALVFWAAGEALALGIKCVVAAVAFYAGYQMFNNKQGKGGGGNAR